MTVVRPERGAPSGFRRRALAGLFLLVALLEEVDADLVAVNPGQFAAAIGEARGRQQQEEFLQMQPLTEPSTVSFAPVSDTSSILHSRRQVPSMPIICASMPRSNVTRSPLRRSVVMCSALKQLPRPIEPGFHAD